MKNDAELIAAAVLGAMGLTLLTAAGLLLNAVIVMLGWNLSVATILNVQRIEYREAVGIATLLLALRWGGRISMGHGGSSNAI